MLPKTGVLLLLLACASRGISPVLAASVAGKRGKDTPKKCDPCPKGIRCVPPIQCPATVRMSESERPQLCDLPAGTHGYCCTSGHNHTIGKPIRDGSRSLGTTDRHHSHVLEPKQLKSIIEEARSMVAHTIEREKKQVATVSMETPSFFHNIIFRSSHEGMMRAIDSSYRAMERIFACRIFKKRENIPSSEFELNQVDVDLFGTPLERGCRHQPQCPPSSPKYRSQDGICNNPVHSTWGATGSPMSRLLPPSYEDGIWEPRTYAVDGGRLPNARTASRELLDDVDRPHATYNLLLMQFGQFLTHDVSQSSSITTAEGKSVSCCSKDGSSVLPPDRLHYSCMPIEIQGDDPFFGHYNQRCINVVRSALSDDTTCNLGYAKQLSKVTHFIDGSAIYGADLKTQSEVRSFRGGELRVLDDFGRPMLPLTENKESCGMERGPCFFAGDGRSNQIITLTALHTIFVREHNRVAAILGDLNRHWSDEIVFYETRQIIIAKIQHILYNEWLPLVVGTETMERFRLGALATGYSTDYDTEVNACVTSEFTTAAFRFGHSAVDGKFVIHSGQKIAEIVDIPELMFNNGRLRRNHFLDEIINTLTTQPMQQIDSAVTHGLSRYLFRGHNPFGLDLAAINIQRGRDHGVRSYNDYLEATGHPRVTDFNQFGYEMAAKLSRVFAHPDDLDLWIGGLLESAQGDALLGPTFADIIADQFSRLRRGDRYFYELSPEINPGYLTLEQLREIRSTSMARLLCDNADGTALRSVPPRAFLRPDVAGNAPVDCENSNRIGRVNYLPWKESRDF